MHSATSPQTPAASRRRPAESIPSAAADHNQPSGGTAAGGDIPTTNLTTVPAAARWQSFSSKDLPN